MNVNVKCRDVPIRFCVPPIRSESLNIEYLPIPSPDPVLVYSVWCTIQVH